MSDAVKTGAERVAALRARRNELGLQRLEIYVHPDDRERGPEIRTQAPTAAG
jgi:hypothetical protein